MPRSSCSFDATIKLWNLTERKELLNLTFQERRDFSGIVLSPDGSTFAVDTNPTGADPNSTGEVSFALHHFWIAQVTESQSDVTIGHGWLCKELEI
jgi:hypothetical protein